MTISLIVNGFSKRSVIWHDGCSDCVDGRDYSVPIDGCAALPYRQILNGRMLWVVVVLSSVRVVTVRRSG